MLSEDMIKSLLNVKTIIKWSFQVLNILKTKRASSLTERWILVEAAYSNNTSLYECGIFQ